MLPRRVDDLLAWLLQQEALVQIGGLYEIIVI